MKYMSVFLTFLVLFGSVTLKNSDAPVYESPVIVKSNELKGRQTNVALNAEKLKASLNSVDLAGQKQTLRSDLIRHFSIPKLEKWVSHLSKEKVDSLSNNDTVNNLNDVKVLSIEMQKNINQTAGKISDLLKLLHLKLKEVDTLKNKIKELSPQSFKKHLSLVKGDTEKLKEALEKEKLKISQVMTSLQAKQTKLIQALSLYDKKFASQNKAKLKDLLTFLNLQLKPQMALPYFTEAYSKLLTFVLSNAKNYTPGELSNYQDTAAELTSKHWPKFLAQARKEWEDLEKEKNSKKEGKQVSKDTKKVIKDDNELKLKTSSHKKKDVRRLR